MAAFDRMKLLCLKKKYLLCTLPRSRPLLFAIVFLGETNRSNLSPMFVQKQSPDVFFKKRCS